MMFGSAKLIPIGEGLSEDSPWHGVLTPAMTVRELMAATRNGEPADVASRSTLVRLLEEERQGRLEIVLSPETGRLRDVYDYIAGTAERPDDPSMAYVITYERNWSEQAEHYDFVGADNDTARLKSLERDIYVSHLETFLRVLADGARVLDAGCGVGRLSAFLLAKGFRLSCVDTSASALKCAARHLLAAGANAAAVDMHLCDVRDMRMFASDSFDATFALELICYQHDPAASLNELARVTAPGGLIFVSVEGAYGSIVADGKIGLEHVEDVLEHARLDLDDVISVRYFSRSSLRSLVEECGLECLCITGTHYVPDGVLGRALDQARLDDPEARRRALALERRCSQDPVLQPLARAWLAVCRKGFHR